MASWGKFLFEENIFLGLTNDRWKIRIFWGALSSLVLLMHRWSMRLLKGTLASGYKLSICWARNYKQGRWTLSRLSCKVRSWSRKSLNFIEKSQVAAQMLLVRIRDWLGALLGPPATMSKMVALLELQQHNEARKPTWSINQSVESFRTKASKQLIMENSISQFSCLLAFKFNFENWGKVLRF